MFTKSNPGGVTPAARTVLQQAANQQQPDPPTPPGAGPAMESSAGGTTIALSKPITTHTGVVRELVLRAATFTDYIENGDIDMVIAGGFGPDNKPTELRTVTNFDGLMKWAVALTGYDRLVLSQLAPSDAGKMMRNLRLQLQAFQQGNS